VAAALSRGLLPLVEAAGEHEIDAALASGAKLVGVNARDLGTFTLDVAAAERALERIPEDRVAMLLSGVRAPEDVRRIAATRADAILVGTELMASPDPGTRLRELLAPE
jgi:indole-3-glycerol phosphate synthase